MFVGMCPGKDGSDESGMIFTSSTTAAPFEALLEHLGITRYDIYLTNLVKCRPASKLTDIRDERVRACWQYLRFEIKEVKPKLIFAMGRLVANQLCGGHPKFYRENLPNITDSVITDRDTGIRVIPVHHPSWVSYSNDASKLEMWLNNIGGIFHVESTEIRNRERDSSGLDRFENTATASRN
jgi:uracil-DNA glycosylase family 4